MATTNPPKIPTKPDQPSFSWEILSSDKINMKVRVNWKPNFTRNSGSHFFVKYRIKDEENWTDIDPTYADDYVTVNSLSRCETYQFQVVSVDGDQMAKSDIQEVFLGEKKTKIIPGVICTTDNCSLISSIIITYYLNINFFIPIRIIILSI